MTTIIRKSLGSHQIFIGVGQYFDEPSQIKHFYTLMFKVFNPCGNSWIPPQIYETIWASWETEGWHAMSSTWSLGIGGS